jgi:3-(3-hydroxy-phenyl)propionate hydroxylase
MPAQPPAPLDAQVAVIGAGPVGLTLAGRLTQHGVSVLLLEQQPRHAGEGSRALCMQRETLEIWQRLGIGQEVAERGVQWSVGRTYFRDRELFSFRLPGSEGEHFPGFVNISQTEVESMLLARLSELRGVDLRWGHRLIGLTQDASGVSLRCQTEGGEREFRAAYLVGTDGAHSGVRHALGMAFPGHTHEDLFLICDVRADMPFPNERRFFFDPPWNPGRQVLVHPQPDGVWRIDWQVPSETDVDAELASGGLDRRIRQVVGRSTTYQLVWHTAYRFHQRLVDHFRVGRVLLAGDAAHLMSPFGARGLNSGAADAENLAWKLAMVLGGHAPDALLDSYHHERRAAAIENLAVTEASMRFMVPHGLFRRGVRNAILRGSVRLPALRSRVNSGRLSQPYSYTGSPIVAPDPGEGGLPASGTVAPDAPCRELGAEPGASRLRELVGDGFVALLVFPANDSRAAATAIRAAGLAWPAACRIVTVGVDGPRRGVTALDDWQGVTQRIYAPNGPRAWLIRPDGHIAGSVALTGKEAVDALPDLQARAIGADRGWRRPAPASRRRVPRRAA